MNFNEQNRGNFAFMLHFRQRILKMHDINQKDAHISVEHWSLGFRHNTDDIPDISVPLSQIKIIVMKSKKEI